MAAKASKPRTQRGPALLYSILSVVLVLLVATLAFTARQPPPPQIAELTPQAQHQITRAPNQLSSNLGSGTGAGGAGSGQGVATTTTLGGAAPTAPPGGPAPIAIPAVHHCFGNPPRQIQDTQSPPCVPYWAGNNGGATSRGVTATSIRICIAKGASSTRVTSDVEAFFNRYFELYGRTMQFIGCGAYGWSATTPEYCAEMRSGAEAMASSVKPFASDDQDTNDPSCYLIGLAQNHVIAVGELAWYDQQTASRYEPYLWSYPMGWNGQFTSIGKFLCTLAGHDASYSPNPVIASSLRKFGIINEYSVTPYPPDPTPLAQQLQRCGSSLALTENIEIKEDTGDQQSSQDSITLEQESENAIIQMKTHGITTVVCHCYILFEEQFPAAADSQAYYPEWLLTDYGNDYNWVVKADWPNADQRKSLLGMSFVPEQVAYPDMTLNWALNLVDPGFQDDGNALDADEDQVFYDQLLLIASGIQMAGPDLTPYSFARGLQLAHFPNPFSPEMEGVAGFNAASNANFMTDDAAVMWWSDTAPSVHGDGNGTWCYADAGRRFSLADWRTTSILPASLSTAPCYDAPEVPPTP